MYWIIVLVSFYFLWSALTQHLMRKTPLSLSVCLFWLMIILFELPIQGSKYFWAGAWAFLLAICLQFFFTHSRVKSIAWKVILLFLLIAYSIQVPLWVFPLFSLIFPFYLIQQKKSEHRLLKLAMIKYLGAFIVAMIFFITGQWVVLFLPALYFIAQIFSIILVSQYVQKNLTS